MNTLQAPFHLRAEGCEPDRTFLFIRVIEFEDASLPIPIRSGPGGRDSQYCELSVRLITQWAMRTR